ncbi:MAG TPA: thioredoxin domain-containing protein [Anaeromyxobacter sp.]|nr:thioredoxin domain-containing protein [Anaeromyxobacter sp.]
MEIPPGAEPLPEPLARRLAEAMRAEPRAEQGPPRFTNRLVLERSPYLLQHAHNPVSWYPWGDEAFETARRTGRPVFLSVGYATCHWCHVMERESFEDLEIARLLNERYLPVKVDREERPDVDSTYMTAVQLLTGGGGWPMSVWLTADREPFFGGTYFPPRSGARGAGRGFLEILTEIADLWASDRLRVSTATASLTEAVRTALSTGGRPAEAPPGPEPILQAVERLDRAFDHHHGGLRRAPKFPSQLPVRLLLRHHRRTGDPRSRTMAERTLTGMAAGGLFDQLGGGFHRYSTDEAWLVPHFEKMLYDNAQLAVAYAEAFQATGRRDFARVARQTLDYLLREMTSPEGGLYSATDADSEGEEGRYFTWSASEIEEVLGAEAAPFMAFHGATAAGNFEGRNVLWLPEPDEERFEAFGPQRERLLRRRGERPPPLRDEKVLAGWNGLAISALAFGGRVLSEPRYLAAAVRAAEFVLARMVREGRLLRSWRAGQAGVPAFLEDHAFLAQGLLDLFEGSFEPRWLAAAIDLSDRLEALFGDPEAGGWFRTAADHERLLARDKPTQDGAEPSGASVAALNALRLEAFTADPRWRGRAEGALRVYRRTLEEEPLALTEMLCALDTATDLAREVVLVWPAGAPPPSSFLEVLRRTFLPNRALAGAAEGPELDRLAAVAPIAAGKVAVGGQPTAYVCQRGACHLPAISAEKLTAQISPARTYLGPGTPPG